MIDFTHIDDDLESTQHLPVLTAELQLKEVIAREIAVRIEVVELFRQNTQLAMDLAQLRNGQDRSTVPAVISADRHFRTEEQLFEVCGALKNTLSRVLGECQTRNIALEAGEAAARTLEDACDSLERILCAPGFRATPVPPLAAPRKSSVTSSQAMQPASRSRPVPLRQAFSQLRPSNVRRLEVVRSDT